MARALFQLRWSGVKPRSLPRRLIIAPNHQSWIDPLVVQAAIYPRQITFLMTELFYDLPVAGLYFRATAARPVREAGPSVAGMRAAIDALEADETICLFPEGGITLDGKLQPGRRGVARLAARTGAFVLPVGVRGTIKVLSRLQPFPRLHPVELRFGELLRYTGDPGRQAEEAFTLTLMEAIRSLAYD